LKTVTYYASTDPLDDPYVYSEAYRTMPAYRREKIDAFVFPEGKKLSMGAELLLRKAVSDLGGEMGEVRTGQYGKPEFIGSDIRFNLSHSGNRVMCSVSDDDVGCDVEKVGPIDLKIARKYFFETEFEAIDSAPEELRCDMFYRFWTLKESFMKATGLGFHLPLDSFRIVLGDTVQVEQHVDGREYHLREFDLDDGYRYACCSIRDIGPIQKADLGSLF